ncbi:LysR family transcriptional regulator [Halomonas sp. V046]|uniref:LysR family transcriptional regulator n=1 Tax=Halomonas sp. V046 TaxID=3459611 RepID=UPI00404497C6
MTPHADSMLWFATIVELESFRRAAERLGVPASTLSRRLTALEESLGIRLLERTTRRMYLTEAGRVFFRHCLAVREEIAQAHQAVERLQSAPRGVLRVASFYTLGSQYLAPLLADFLRQYPDIRLELELGENAVHQLEKGADIALHVGDLDTPGYRFRQLGEAVMRLYASPEYLTRHGAPQHPADLEHHVTLAHAACSGARHVEWELWQESAPGHRLSVKLEPTLMSNEPTTALNTALGGHGIYFGTTLMARPHLFSERLVPVLPHWRGPTIAFHAVFASREGVAPKLRVFLDFIAERIADHLR